MNIFEWLGFEPAIEAKKRDEELKQLIEKLMATVAERFAAIESSIDELSGKQTEALGEITTELQKLRDQLGNTITPEADATLGRIETKTAGALAVSKQLADIIPNA